MRDEKKFNEMCRLAAEKLGVDWNAFHAEWHGEHAIRIVLDGSKDEYHVTEWGQVSLVCPF